MSERDREIPQPTFIAPYLQKKGNNPEQTASKMSPTIALKCRMANNMIAARAAKPPSGTMAGLSHRSNLPGSFRSVSIGSEVDRRSPTLVPQGDVPEDDEGVQLLLGIAQIVSKEMADCNTEIFDDDEDDDALEKDYEGGSDDGFCQHPVTSGGRSLESPCSFVEEDDMFAWNRVRTVSMDSPNGVARATERVPPLSLTLPAIVTPVGNRGRNTRKATLKTTPHKGKKEHVKFPKLPQLHQALPSVLEHKRKAMEICAADGATVKTIMRRKFSWKNYPELEAFLIANREEYLRHSALNYTLQQKQYNNTLTERLLDLAADHGYCFDEDEFSFVTVRDRIRCYYKSYVQSSKKRGVVLGYAARKAGILTPAELQKSAKQQGTIVTPEEL